jgi:hypothetical protein
MSEDHCFPITGVDFDEKQGQIEDLNTANLYSIPRSVNYIALRESLLSEAPFVKKGSKGMWRRMIDSKSFSNMLGCVYSMLNRSISDGGSLNVDRLRDLENAELPVMGKNFSDMFYTFSRLERDAYMPKLPEVMTYMVVNCLHNGEPKHYRMYNSVRFREILLDHLSELYGGIRLTDCTVGRHWLFHECMDVPIFMTSRDTKKAKDPVVSSASSRYPLQISPLVSRSMGKHLSQLYSDNLGVTMTLGHLPDRQLMTLPESPTSKHKRKIGKPRYKVSHTGLVQKTLNESREKKDGIMFTLAGNSKEMRSDLKKFKELCDLGTQVVQREYKQKMMTLTFNGTKTAQSSRNGKRETPNNTRSANSTQRK